MVHEVLCRSPSNDAFYLQVLLVLLATRIYSSGGDFIPAEELYFYL